MKCPSCGYVSFDYLVKCAKCSKSLESHRMKYGFDLFLEPAVMGLATYANIAKVEKHVDLERSSVEDFDIADDLVDDNAEAPISSPFGASSFAPNADSTVSKFSVSGSGGIEDADKEISDAASGISFETPAPSSIAAQSGISFDSIDDNKDDTSVRAESRMQSSGVSFDLPDDEPQEYHKDDNGSGFSLSIGDDVLGSGIESSSIGNNPDLQHVNEASIRGIDDSPIETSGIELGVSAISDVVDLGVEDDDGDLHSRVPSTEKHSAHLSSFDKLRDISGLDRDSHVDNEEDINIDLDAARSEISGLSIDSEIHESRPPTVSPTMGQSRPPTVPPSMGQSRPPTVPPSMGQSRPPTVPPSMGESRPPTVPPSMGQSRPPTVPPSMGESRPPTVPPSMGQSQHSSTGMDQSRSVAESLGSSGMQASNQYGSEPDFGKSARDVNVGSVYDPDNLSSSDPESYIRNSESSVADSNSGIEIPQDSDSNIETYDDDVLLEESRLLADEERPRSQYEHSSVSDDLDISQSKSDSGFDEDFADIDLSVTDNELLSVDSDDSVNEKSTEKAKSKPPSDSQIDFDTDLNLYDLDIGIGEDDLGIDFEKR